MRTSVYTFLLITCLLLTPYAVLAGTDDSGLQVFEVNGANTTGMKSFAITEDTGIAEELINLIPSDFGLYSLLDFGDAFPTSGNYKNVKKTFIDGTWYGDSAGELLALLKATPSSGTTEVIFYSAAGGITTEIYTTGSTINTFFSSFLNGNIYVLNGANFGYFSASAPAAATPISKPWTTMGAACIFKNRLWVAEQSVNTYLWYSTAQDYDDFTTVSGRGGVFNISSRSGVKKLLPTNYGLYIFCDNDIYLLSGGDTPASWRIDKVFEGYSIGNNGSTAYYATVIGNDIYFLSSTKTLYRISGNQIQLIDTMPQKYGSYITNYASCGQFKNRFFILTNRPNINYGIAYDLQRQCWFLLTEFSYIVQGTDSYYVKTATNNDYFDLKITPNFSDSDTYYGKQIVYPWQWNSSWVTLDGNSNTYKEIDRIEFEFQGGTTTVIINYAATNDIFKSSTKTFSQYTNYRVTTSIWNAPVGKIPVNKLFFSLYSSGPQTQTVNYVIKKIRVYYRNLGSYRTLRSSY